MHKHGQNSSVYSVEQAVDLFSLHHAFPDRYPFLLQSVSHGTQQARFDILFAFPGDRLWLNSDYGLFLNDKKLKDNDFLQQLDRFWESARSTLKTDGNSSDNRDWPFRGGWFLFLGYELASQVEPKLGRLPTFPNQHVASAFRIPAALIHDHATKDTVIVLENLAAAGHVEQIHEDIRNCSAYEPAVKNIFGQIKEAPADEFLDGVARVKKFIRDGDVFQVNLSRLWKTSRAKLPDADQLYWQLRQTNPSPFAGIACVDRDTCIVSSSPERLVQVKAGIVSTRPIAGTFPRAQDREEDAGLPKALVSNPKERAEHIMLIDLERNDLGRVCAPGSVNVEELMTVETYEHVHHIVSQVTGRIRPEETPGSIIAAVFPGGTITGCPKVRCMEIIRDLEQGPRGAYTGSMGYLNHDGDMDLNILIRTLVHSKDEIVFRAGSGLVADSVPERELAETRAKARGLLRALGQVDDA